jgi:hypothetical protein
VLMDLYRVNAMAGSSACNLILSEPMVIYSVWASEKDNRVREDTLLHIDF